MLQIAKVMTLTAQEITAKLTEQYKDVQVGIEFITPEQAQIYMGRNFKNNRKVVLSNISVSYTHLTLPTILLV